MVIVITPNVHTNGTSRDELVRLRCETMNAIRQAIARLDEMAPNGRDYYHSPGLMGQATAQHARRRGVLESLLREINQETENLFAQET